MDLCDDGHTEVCYDGGSCPMCDLDYEKQKEIDALETEVDALKAEIKEMI